MNRPFLVAEDTGPASRHVLFHLFGVTWAATGYAWLAPLSWCAIGIAVAVAEHRPGGNSRLLVVGIGYGLLLLAANVLHSVGHIAAGRLARTPMAVNVLTSTRDVNVYLQPGTSAPPGRRLVRSLGGPTANLLVGVVALAGAPILETRWLSMFGYLNVGVGLWTLAPVPTMDGWVIWRTVFRGRGR